MAELNLKQITDRLNAAFSGDVRKLIFWYDENAEFVEDIDALELDNAKVLRLEPDNQFYIKYFLEYVDKDTNYLVYAPFSKPAIKENHLADTIRYSQEFFLDKASLVAYDLGIDDRFKPVLQKYIKFFSSKERSQRFYDLEVETFNRSSIEIALMTALCKIRNASFEEVVRCVITDGDLEENRLLADFEKYGLLKAFWQNCEIYFGYQDTSPTLEKLMNTMLVTHWKQASSITVPAAWKSYVSYKSGSMIAFVDHLMNSVLYSERFDEIAGFVSAGIQAEQILASVPTEELLDCTVFPAADSLLLHWITSRLENEDIGAMLDGNTIPEICEKRGKTHFGGQHKDEYQALQSAWSILKNALYTPQSGFQAVADRYIKGGFELDRQYRFFNLHYDRVEDTAEYERVQQLVERVYSDLLGKTIVNWNDFLPQEQENCLLTHQQDFYKAFVKANDARTVVIISDALRYEVGQSLVERLSMDEKCTVSFSPMLSVLPSYTRFGMAALLPHKTLEMSKTYQVLVDGKPCDDLKGRQAILQSYCANSRCIQYDELKAMDKTAMRDVFTGMEVVYVYHNQIDSRGDKPTTENEVFQACEEAVEEIAALIRRLTNSANTTHFIVTADHGFLYKRDKLSEGDKIGGVNTEGAFVGKRYIVADGALHSEGVTHLELSKVLRNDDSRMISFPMGSDIFKTAGGGMNFVHGGSSPQEMIVPVIEVKTAKGHKETSTAQISLVSLTNKITNLITSLDFLQTEAVSDVVKATTYRIYFVDSDGALISNENIYEADNRNGDTAKRVFRLRFSFKNQKYQPSRKYYLVAYDSKNNLEVLRHEVIMDIAFADDFGFDL